MRWLKWIIVALVVGSVLYFGANWYAQVKIEKAFARAGMSDRSAQCMGERLTRKLNYTQIARLLSLQKSDLHPEHLSDTLRSLDDPKLVHVTVKSAVLCSMGFAR